MKELVNNMLAEIEVNISEIDLYGYDIVETFLSIVRRSQAVLNDLKTKLQIHSFYKIYRIETQCPDGSNDVIRNYIKNWITWPASLTVIWTFTNIIVFIRPCMMNIMLFVESLIYAYVPIAHNSIKTWISQPCFFGWH